MLNSEQLSKIVVHAMEELKAQNIKVLDVRNISGVTDFLVISSGTSNRQVSAIADKVVEDAKTNGQRILGIEGKNPSEWVLVDLGDVVAHVMQPHIRDFYQLERLWSNLEETPRVEH